MCRAFRVFIPLLIGLFLLGCRYTTPTLTATGPLPSPILPTSTATAPLVPTPTPLPTTAQALPTASPTLEPTATQLPTPEILGTLPGQTRRRIDRTWNILFLGSDRRKPTATYWHTDAIMLIMIDKETYEVAVVSIPRDLYLKIPGYKEERINVVDAVGERTRPNGGPALMRRIFWEYFRVRVDNYLRLDIPGLLRIFEVLGPVEVDIACEQTLYYEGKTYHFLPGPQRLTPEELYIYMTKRAGKDDIDRIRRQQRGLLALRKRVKELDLLPKLPALYRELSQNVQTDLSLLDLIWLGNLALNISTDKVYGFALDYTYLQPYTTPDGNNVLIVRNWNTVREAIANVFNEGKPIAEFTQERCR